MEHLTGLPGVMLQKAEKARGLVNLGILQHGQHGPVWVGF